MNFVKGCRMSEPVIAQKSPYGVDVEAGQEYWWCACGQSESQPLCDGSHKGTGLSPQKYSATETAKVWFCGCKNTADIPVCDGTHSKL
jgi:CDGSH-type Zn-finger protein